MFNLRFWKTENRCLLGPSQLQQNQWIFFVFFFIFQVINLVGPDSQQDIELSALYKDAILTYGEGKVLGILATKSNDHLIRKRQTKPVEPAAGGGEKETVTVSVENYLI